MDLLDVAQARIEEAGYATAGFRRLDQSLRNEGIVIRELPATTRARYYGGERDVEYYFQVISKRLDEERSRDEINGICDLLEGADMASQDGSYTITSLVVDAEPGAIEIAEDKYHPWAATFLATITTKERV